MMRQLAMAMALFCVACSGNQPTAQTHPSPPYYLQVSRYATRIAEVSKTIHDCVSAEAHASASHPDLSFMTDREKAICGGDDASVDAFLSFDVPSGFDSTGSSTADLKADLENHDIDHVNSDYDMHLEAEDLAAILRTFNANLGAANLTGAVKRRILKRV